MIRTITRVAALGLFLSAALLGGCDETTTPVATPDVIADTTADVAADTSVDVEVATPEDKCLGTADMAIIDGTTKDAAGAAYDSSGAAATCAISCVGETDTFTCVFNCVKAVVPLSDDCNGCYSESAKCAIDKCASICLSKGSDSVECVQCREDEGCTPGFYTCSGLPVPTS